MSQTLDGRRPPKEWQLALSVRGLHIRHEPRELHRGADAVSITPQVFDLLDYLIRNRERVVSKDELIGAVWNGRIVSDAALTTRLNAARNAIGDSGEEQRLLKTLPRKGFRFVGSVQETQTPAVASVATHPGEQDPERIAGPEPSCAVDGEGFGAKTHNGGTIPARAVRLVFPSLCCLSPTSAVIPSTTISWMV